MGSSNQANIAASAKSQPSSNWIRRVDQGRAIVFVGFVLALSFASSAAAQSYASFGDQSPPVSTRQTVERSRVEMRSPNTLNANVDNRAIAPPTPIDQRGQRSVATVSYQQSLPKLSGPRTGQPNANLLYEDYLGDETKVTPNSLHPTPDAVRRLRNSYSNDLPVARFAKSVSTNTLLPAIGRQEDPFGDNQKPPVAKPRSIQPTPMQPRATNPPAFDPAPGAFEPTSNAFPPNRVTPRNTSPRQEDPFGDNQKPPVANPTPRQEDPFGDNQKPPVANPTPPKDVAPGNTNPTNPRTPVTQPRTTPRGQLPNVQPSIDPALQSPTVQDPQLPPDAQGGNIRPTNPRGIVRPSNPTNQQNPPDTGTTQDGRGQGGDPNFQPNRPKVDNSISYEQGSALPERSPQEMDSNFAPGVYRPPSEVPPTYPRQVQPTQPLYQPGYEVVPNMQPQGGEYFVPAFEPIPGLVPDMSQPRTMHRQPVMPAYQQPPLIHPMDRQPNYGQPDYGQPVLVNETYSPVVADANACQPCQSGFDACGQPTYPKPGFLRSLFMDDVQMANCEPACNAFYFSFQGGWNDLQNMIDGRETELETETGSAFVFAMGRINGRNLRTEVELAFRDNDISNRLSFGAPTFSSGDISSFSGMGNLYWEFVDFPGGRFRPYVGFGVGFASLEANLVGQFGNSILAPDGGNDTSFAYQWMAGMNYKANPNMDLFVEYRFFEADSIVLTSTGNVSDKYNYQANNVGIGLRWKF